MSSVAIARLGVAMLRFSLAFVALALTLAACTDWDAGVNGGIAVSNPPPSGSDVDQTGLVWWETQGSGSPDTAIGSDDAAGGSDDVLVVDILGDDVTSTDAAGIDASFDSGKDGLIAPDGVLDSANACSGSNRPIGCDCASSQQCASGLCVNGPNGLVCSPTCKTVDCPSGWECVAPALVCKQLADAVIADAGTTDTAADTAQVNDGATLDAQDNDGVAVDAAPTDVQLTDVGVLDGDLGDGWLFDIALDSNPPLDADDATVADVNDAVTDADVVQPDGQLTDALTDAVSDTGDDVNDAADIDTDGLTGLDWVGYPDAIYPDDADIYGGAINSCLSLYLYQQETCGHTNPTAACIDSVASQGSLYANYLFEPVRACEDAYCVDLCATAVTETCMSDCVGKHCPNQFLSCVSNDQHGTADCQATFSCAMGYPGKLLTIGAKCYANGTLDAQLQVGGLISCETKPNTQSCFQAIGNCYDQGAAATNTCMQTVNCTQACGSAQECVWTCLGKANPAGRKAIDALGNCLVTVCGPKCNGDQTCQNACLGTDCAAQFSACMAN